MDRNGTPHLEPGAQTSAGPWPCARWMTDEEVAVAVQLLAELPPELDSHGVKVSRGAGCRCLEVPYPKHPGETLVLVLPSREGLWRDASRAGFYFVMRTQPRWP